MIKTSLGLTCLQNHDPSEGAPDQDTNRRGHHCRGAMGQTQWRIHPVDGGLSADAGESAARRRGRQTNLGQRGPHLEIDPTPS